MQKVLPVFTNAFGPEDKFVLYVFHSCSRRALSFFCDRAELHSALRALEWMVVPVRDF